MSPQSNTPAGWYPDPSDSQRVRYWDGGNWSGRSRPASSSAAISDSLESSASTQGPRPWWQTWFAIIPGLLLCLPLGLVGLWRRHGTSTVMKTVVTAGTVLLLAIAAVMPDDSASTSTIPVALPSDTPSPSLSPSASPSLAMVPAVKGLSLTKAKRKLRSAGLEVGDIDRRPSSKRKDTVLKQGVREGTELEPVRVWLSLSRRRTLGCPRWLAGRKPRQSGSSKMLASRSTRQPRPEPAARTGWYSASHALEVHEPSQGLSFVS
jgi:hypothetical protein